MQDEGMQDICKGSQKLCSPAQEGDSGLQQHGNDVGPAAAFGAKGGLEAFRGWLIRHEIAVSPPCTPPCSCFHEPAARRMVEQSLVLMFFPCSSHLVMETYRCGA